MEHFSIKHFLTHTFYQTEVNIVHMPIACIARESILHNFLCANKPDQIYRSAAVIRLHSGDCRPLIPL